MFWLFVFDCIVHFSLMAHLEYIFIMLHLCDILNLGSYKRNVILTDGKIITFLSNTWGLNLACNAKCYVTNVTDLLEGLI